MLVKFTEMLFLECIIMLMTMSNSDLKTWLILVVMRSNDVKISTFFFLTSDQGNHKIKYYHSLYKCLGGGKRQITKVEHSL